MLLLSFFFSSLTQKKNALLSFTCVLLYFNVVYVTSLLFSFVDVPGGKRAEFGAGLEICFDQHVLFIYCFNHCNLCSIFVLSIFLLLLVYLRIIKLDRHSERPSHNYLITHRITHNHFTPDLSDGFHFFFYSSFC